jgi:hypothetical protein
MATAALKMAAFRSTLRTIMDLLLAATVSARPFFLGS